MSNDSGGSPEFGIEGIAIGDVTYDHDAIAENVLWPLADYCHGEDWRLSARAEQDLLVEEEAGFKKHLYKATLFANNTVSEELDEESGECSLKLIPTITLGVYHVVNGGVRKIILNRAEETFGSYVDKFNWDDVDAMVGASYTIRSNGKLEVESSQLLQHDSLDVIWGSDVFMDQDDLDGSGDQVTTLLKYKIREHDIENMQAGLHVLNAPKAIKKALKEIKRNPIET